MYWSRFLPVMAVTALMWPKFSATRMITTGTMSSMALALNTGVCRLGKPSHGAAMTPPMSTGLPQPRPLVNTA